MKIVCRLLLVFVSLAACVGAHAQNRMPLPVPDAPDLYQRVLTLPGASLSRDRGAPPGAGVLPTFSILYVFGRAKVGDEDWLEVGSKIRGEPEGWLPKKVTHDWHTMLVMQYAPRGQRSRVAFFDTQAALEKLLSASDSSKRGQAIVAGLEQNHPDPSIIATEPENAVDEKSRFYVIPVLSAKPTQLADGSYVRVVQVASANAVPPPLSNRTPPPTPNPAPDKFRIGLVFLLDTTMSMGPYIDATAEFARSIVDKLGRTGIGDRVSIGVVAYRSSMAKEPRLEYVTRIFSPLDPDAPLQNAARALGGITEARYSTPAWDEDAFAGLHVALNDLNWEPFAARFLIMVTDSGPLPGNSPLVKFGNFDIENVVELANARHIAVFPFHLLTREGSTHNRAYAVGKWRRLGQTGDPSVSKYKPVPAGSVDELRKALNEDGDALVASLAEIAAGHVIGPPDISDAGESGAGSEPPAAAALVNELFRAQAEYMGAKKGVTAPQFFRAWASDHDLAKPRVRALNVQVFLTRTQLSALAQSLVLIVEQAKQAALAPQDFFQNLQVLAAQTASDPNRPMRPGPVESIEASNLLPAYLKLLPYHSKVMDMTRNQWLSGGVTGQQEFIDELSYKVRLYRDIDADVSRWKRLDASNQGGPTEASARDAVSPIPLDILP